MSVVDNDDHGNTPRSLHRRAWDLIPWVVAGSADAVERRLVEQHAADCADCRDELAFHHRLHAGMAAQDATAPDPTPALQRLLARIDMADGSAASDATAPQSVPGAAGARRPGLTRWLAAAVVVQAIGLAGLVGLLRERPDPNSAAGDYQTLSRTTPAPSAATIRLVPAADLSLGELRSLLARSGIEVVESSADAAIFGVAPQPGAVAGAGIGETLRRLRAEPGVLLAEPITGVSTAVPAPGTGR